MVQCCLPAADGVAAVNLPAFAVDFVDGVAAYFGCWLIVAAENK